MQAELESIKTGYDTLGLSPEEISLDRGLELASVKAALLQCSSKYRKDVGAVDDDKKEELDFTNTDLKMINQVILEKALYGESEDIQLRAAMYIRDDKKGRKELRTVLGGNTFNILAFNQNMQRVRENAERSKLQVMEA